MSSKTGQNIQYMMDKHKMDFMAKLVVEKNNLKKLRLNSFSEEEKWKVSLKKEVALVRKEQLELDIGDKNLEEVLEAIYTS